ncbi:Cof-type HAD-IIB family hydrolase [Pengzhenrongella sicca]|uniref:HAD family hydrolase n=1 Tax=Pengzhenrongella sicca TaxID=2819238 RepID=A0A8A4ZFU8_9MICO|nr:Cof-type HAD-IIB family hydrolase [Pengzhenrongella sicca]QTE30892.1 HAD family hydrolase [Pengzhenrongella sicca]
MTQTAPIDVALQAFDPRPDIRLIAADMDGTLLDDSDALPDALFPLVHELHRRGITFCPASGRQYFNLLERFRDVADDMVFIAENGAYVVGRGEEISSECLAPDDVGHLVAAIRTLATSGADVGAVVGGKRSAYVERRDPAFLAQVGRYFTRIEVVEDLRAVTGDEFVKVAVYDFGDAERTSAPSLARFRDALQVVVSGEHWVDVMSRSANKGDAIRRLQATLGVTADQTMVFGDFLNDLEMMDAATYSFAMDNAHPDLRARASYLAPANSANGVVRTISSVLGLPWTA